MKKNSTASLILFGLIQSIGLSAIAANTGLFYPFNGSQSLCWYDIEYSSPAQRYVVTAISNPISREYCAQDGNILPDMKVVPLDDGNVLLENYHEDGQLKLQTKLQKAAPKVSYQPPLIFKVSRIYSNLSHQQIHNCMKIGVYNEHLDRILKPWDFADQTPLFDNDLSPWLTAQGNNCERHALAGIGCYVYEQTFDSTQVSSNSCSIFVTTTYRNYKK